MKKIIVSILILIGGYNCSAQNVFEKNYSVDVDNALNIGNTQMISLPDSGYAFAAPSYNNNNNSLLVGRINKLGVVSWAIQVDDSFQILAGSIAKSFSDFFYVTFSSYSSQEHHYSTVVLKLNSTNGSLIWCKRFTAAGRTQWSEHVFVTASSFYVCGETYTTPAQNSDIYLLKIDTLGNLNWGKLYNTGMTDYLRDAKLLRGDDILLSGRTLDSLNREYATEIRVDSAGNVKWNRIYHLPTYKTFNAQAVNEDSSGNLLISGHVDTVSSTIGFGLWDIFLMKLSANGNFKWANIYGGSDYDEDWSVNPTDDKGYILGAEPESYGNRSRLGLLKTDSMGILQWLKLYGDTSGGFTNCAVINPDKGFTIFGTDGDWSQNAAMVLIKTDSMGYSSCPNTDVSIQSNSFQPIEDSVMNVTTFSGQNPFNINISNFPFQAHDYCDPILTPEIDLQLPFYIYPNPTTNLINIHSANPVNDVCVTDLAGKVVLKASGTHIDISSLASGLYFIIVKTNDWVVTEKFVKE